MTDEFDRATAVSWLHSMGIEIPSARQINALQAHVKAILATQHPSQSAGEPVAWRELCRRLYVELFHCDQQMMSTLDEEGEPMWTQGALVRDVLRDAKKALETSPPPTAQQEAGEPVATEDARPWPAGLIDRVKAAEKRIDDGHAPRRIPADPNGDVDLVLAEVRHLLEGKAPPFWIAPPPTTAAAPVDGLRDLLMEIVCDTEHPDRQLRASRMLEVMQRVPTDAARAAEPMPNGEQWDPNPDGIQPGQESGPRMDRHTGMWDVSEDDAEDVLADEAVAAGRTPGDSVPGVSTAALVRAAARAAEPDAARASGEWHAPGLGEVHNADHTQMIYCDDGDGMADDALARKVCDALNAARVETDRRDAEIERLRAIINTPQSDDFLRAVSIEAEHQRQRWPSEHDEGKTPADWYWLVGYLGGKALHSHAAGNIEKAEHHIITTAAACANWHRAMFGRTNMRPGIDGDAALAAERKGGA